MFRRLLLLLFITLGSQKAFSQVITLNDLTTLAYSNDKAVVQLLTKQKDFKRFSTSTENNVVINTFALFASRSTEIVRTKRNITDNTQSSLEYHVLPLKYVVMLKKQLISNGFLFTSKRSDNKLDWSVYKSRKLEFDIYIMQNGLPAIIDIVKNP